MQLLRRGGGLAMLARRLAAAALFLGCVAAAPRSPLILTAPIVRWDEAIPLGNGLTGGLLWGGEGHINLSLDRGDLWDQRLPAPLLRSNWTYATMKRLERAGNQAELSRLFDDPYYLTTPTKLPVARLVIDLPGGVRAQRFALDYADAQGRADLTGGKTLRAFFSACEPVAFVHLPFAAPRLHIVRPAGLDRLGYAPAATGTRMTSGMRVQWMTQRAANGLRYAVTIASRAVDGGSDIAIAVTADTHGRDPLAAGERRVVRALARGYVRAQAAHAAWWKRFWSISDVQIPNLMLQRQYDFAKYLYGAGSRRGAPPIPLQGVWTADEGGLPPWKGDFHNDLNTQMTYLAYPEAGLFDSGASFLDFNWQRLPSYERFARRFYGVPGAVVPGVETLDGTAIGGWAQYALSPTMGAWVAQSFYLHWRYTMDRAFLHARAYPFTARIGTSLAALLRPDANGKLVLPLSSSPEIFDNSLHAWLPADSNFDTALLHWLYAALAEMATADRQPLPARHWAALRARLGELDTQPNADGTPVLTLAHGIPFDVSHRHFSHAIGIYPLGIISVHDSSATRRLIDASVANIAARGTSAWTGYSFAWMSAMQARLGNADLAFRYLADFDRAFVSRNGFHLNGDQLHAGLSANNDNPFTLEGNFLAMQAVHEMLLQSADGIVRVFPATLAAWRDVAFTDLRAEGGFRISAVRAGGRMTTLHVTATVDGPLRLADPFPANASVVWSRSGLQLSPGVRTFGMHAGETLTAALRGVHIDGTATLKRRKAHDDGIMHGRALVTAAGAR